MGMWCKIHSRQNIQAKFLGPIFGKISSVWDQLWSPFFWLQEEKGLKRWKARVLHSVTNFFIFLFMHSWYNFVPCPVRHSCGCTFLNSVQKPWLLFLAFVRRYEPFDIIHFRCNKSMERVKSSAPLLTFKISVVWWRLPEQLWNAGF